MNDGSDSPLPLPPELDPDRSTETSAAVPMAERERTLLTAVAAELAALSNRTENASLEVASIEGRMQNLVEVLTTAAGADFDESAPPKPAASA